MKTHQCSVEDEIASLDLQTKFLVVYLSKKFAFFEMRVQW